VVPLERYAIQKKVFFTYPWRGYADCRGNLGPSNFEGASVQEELALAADLNLQRFAVATDCRSVINNMEQPFGETYSMILAEIKSDSAKLRTGFI
jgi:hypothetical protein